MPLESRRTLDALLLALAAFLLLFGLGSNSLHDEDEARYALVQLHVLETGDWLDFEVQGHPWMNKAPLRIWASAALGAVFGVDEWTVRLPSALAGLGAIAALLWLGRLLYGVTAARWAALVLLTSTQFLYHHCARTGEMDSSLLLVWILAVCFALKVRDDARWWIASLVCVGLAGMVKHAFYVVPVGGVALATLLLDGRWKRIPASIWALALLAFTVVLVPWHALMLARHGADFADVYFAREVGERVAVHAERGSAWVFFASVIKDGLFPWSLLLPFALLWFTLHEDDRRPGFLLLLWAVPMVAGPAAARFDLAWYALPALPALALLVGRWLSRTVIPVWMALTVGVLVLLFPSNVMEFDALDTGAIFGMIGARTLGTLRGTVPWWPQILLGAITLVAALAYAKTPRRRRVAILGAWTAFAVLHAGVPLRHWNVRSDVETLVDRVLERAEPGDRFVALLAPQLHTEAAYTTLFDPIDDLSDRFAFALRRLPPTTERVMVGVDPVPPLEGAWVIGPLRIVGGTGAVPDALHVRGWAARPPGANPRAGH